MDTTQVDIEIRRVYDDAVRDGSATRGRRVFLVDRVWPRGIRKNEVRVDAWLRQVAPSGELRRWFGHLPERWEEFQDRYRAELAHGPEGIDVLVEAARQVPVTLLYSASDTERNNAVVLRSYVMERLGGSGG